MKYDKGRRYRVARSGSRLCGMKPGSSAESYSSCYIQLEVGDVLTCAGDSMTMGDGWPAVKWLDAEGNHIAHDCTFWPQQGGYGICRPKDGYLVPMDT
jgi:hypothetical protein